MIKATGLGLALGLFVGCGSKDSGTPASVVSPSSGETNGTPGSATATSNASSAGVGSGGTSADTSGTQGLDDTALLECAALQVPCNRKCLSPGESSMGCTYLAFVDTSTYLVQGFDLRGDNIYVGLVGFEVPDLIRVFDKTTGADKYEVQGASGTIQQVAVTDTHLGWTENDGGTLHLYATKLGETQPTALYDMLGFTKVSAITSGWLVPEDGQLLLVEADGGEPRPLGITGEGIDEIPVVERNGTLYYRTGGLLDPHQLWSASLSGAETKKLTEVGGIDAFHVDENDIYLIESDGSTLDPRFVSRVPLSGGIPQTISPLNDALSFTLSGHGEFLYTTESEKLDTSNDTVYAARLVRIVKATGAMSIIAVTEHDVSNVFADASGVYFTRSGAAGLAILKVQ